MAERKKTTQSKPANLDDLVHLSLLYLGDVSDLKDVSHPEMTDQMMKLLKRRSLITVCYMHRCANSCAVLAFLNVNYKVHYSCYLNIAYKG